MSEKSIKVTLNGKPFQIRENTRLQEVLVGLNLPSLDFGVAVAINGKVIPKEEWPTVNLGLNDKVDVVRAFQGG